MRLGRWDERSGDRREVRGTMKGWEEKVKRKGEEKHVKITTCMRKNSLVMSLILKSVASGMYDRMVKIKSYCDTQLFAFHYQS